ncbi:MAG TPA: hypothetical protein VI032_19760 [Burkholderiaceae bacterium]
MSRAPAGRAAAASSKRRQPEQVTVARDQAAEPRLPHEHDESADSQARDVTQPDAIGRKAFDDVMAGRVDTDRGPVLEELARTSFQPAAPVAPRKRPRRR